METAGFHRLRFSHLSRWLVLFTLAHFGHHLLTALPTPLLPFFRSEFGLDYAGSGLALSVFSITYGVSQLPGGALADRLGARRLMTLGIIGVAAAGLAIYFTRSYFWLLVCLGLMGLVGGGYHPAAPPLVCATVPPGSRGRALGVHAIGGSASFFIAPLVVAATAVVWGWRESYLVLAVPTLLFGLLLYVTLGRFEGNNGAGLAPAADSPPPEAAGRPDFLFFVALSAAGTIMVVAGVSYVPLLLVDGFGVSEESAAAILAVVYLAGIFANMAVGFLTDRFSKKAILIATLMASAAALAAFNAAPYAWGTIGLLSVLGALIVILQNAAESFVMAGTHPRRCSSVLGRYYFATIAGGGLFTPLFGALIDRRGFAASYVILALLLLLAAAFYAAWLRRSG